MKCTERVVEVVECARRGAEPGPDLRSHLATCLDCGARWEAERQLTSEFRTIRARTAGRGSPAFQRQILMRDFAARQQRMPVVLKPKPRPWIWALSAAAALLVAVFIGHTLGVRARQVPPAPAGIRTHGVQATGSVLYEASFDASALSSDEFIAIPYTPALAPGEMVRVVHTDLYPGALASMGLEVTAVWREQEWPSRLPADVVFGGDGFPRAVRFTGDTQSGTQNNVEF
jgi:hypothetical protein